MIRLMGIDPGLRFTGWGVIAVDGNRLCHVADGVIATEAPLAFPGVVEAALRVERVGRSSVKYGVGLFAEGSALAAAEGWFVHVFVDRVSRRPSEIGAGLRGALGALLVG